MKLRHIIIAGISVLLAGMLASCADALGPERTLAQTDQSVEVVPCFEVKGTAELPDRLIIEELGLTVSTIELTPVGSSDTGIAYAAGEPIQVNFDVESGERIAKSRSLILPEAGVYDVSVRLEPIEGTAPQPYSLRMSGHASEKDVDPDIDLQALGEYMEGQPVPIPLDDEGEVDDMETSGQGLTPEEESSGEWEPFAFHSERKVEHKLDRVKLEPGQQALRFQVDVHDWALELVQPVTEAVEEKAAEESDSSVDASQQISRRGEGPTGVDEYMTVSTRPYSF